MPRGPEADPAWVYSQLLRLYPQAASAPLCVAFQWRRKISSAAGPAGAAGPWAAARHPRRSRAASGFTDLGAAVPQHLPRTGRAVRDSSGRGPAPSSGHSLEAAARDARYAALAAALRPGEVLLTAHHLEDQLETVLLQLLRGAGLPKVLPTPARRDAVRRGGAWCGRCSMCRAHALRAWVKARGLACVADPANTDDRFDRNYLRHRVLPGILGRWPGAAPTPRPAAPATWPRPAAIAG